MKFGKVMCLGLVMFTLGWGAWNTRYIANWCLRSFTPSPQHHVEKREIYRAIKTHTKSGQPILCLDIDDLPMRYKIFRSLAFSPNDGRVLHYTNRSKLVDWSRDMDRYYQMMAMPWSPERWQFLGDFVRDKKAEWLIFRHPESSLAIPKDLGRLVWSRDQLALVKIVYDAHRP